MTRYNAQKLVFNETKIYFESKLNESIAKPIKLWKGLKYSG